MAARVAWRHAPGTGGAAGWFDLVVSNPPYVRSGDRATLAPEVRREPDVALFAGHDGLDAVRAIAGASYDVLQADGTLVMEIGAGQSAEAQAIVRAAGFAEVSDARRPAGDSAGGRGGEAVVAFPAGSHRSGRDRDTSSGWG